MSTILIQNGDIVTLDDHGTIHYATDILLEDGRIAAIDKEYKQNPDKLIDASGSVVMPGFFNAHCHAPMTFVRGWAEDLPFPRWLNEKIWVAESALTAQDVYWGAMLAACEMIKSGTVAFNDFYFYMDEVAKVVEQSGLKATLSKCVFGIGEDKEIDGGLDVALAFSQAHHNTLDGRLRTSLGPHSPYICPPDVLQEIAEHAKAMEQPVHIHLAESQEQVTVSKEKYGKSPVQHIHDLGLLDGQAILAHCLALSSEDIEILASQKANIARTPITYMKLAMPVNALAPILSAGIHVALGSDGPASNNDMDMLAVLRQTAMLEKYLQEDPEQLSGDLPLRMATQEGAKAMGFADSGKIVEGGAADIIILDFKQASLRPRHDLVANLVFSAKGGDVTHTIVNGKILMEDRQLTTLDEAEIIAQAEERAFKMVNSPMAQVRCYGG